MVSMTETQGLNIFGVFILIGYVLVTWAAYRSGYDSAMQKLQRRALERGLRLEFALLISKHWPPPPVSTIHGDCMYCGSAWPQHAIICPRGMPL